MGEIFKTTERFDEFLSDGLYKYFAITHGSKLEVFQAIKIGGGHLCIIAQNSDKKQWETYTFNPSQKVRLVFDWMAAGIDGEFLTKQYLEDCVWDFSSGKNSKYPPSWLGELKSDIHLISQYLANTGELGED